MRVLWDTNVVVAGLVFARGQAAQALYSGWERWPQLLITQWIDAEAARILEAKFHVAEVWPGVRSRFLVLADPPDATIASGCGSRAITGRRGRAISMVRPRHPRGGRMGVYMDALRLAGIGLIACGGISYGLIMVGVSPVLATVACVGMFFLWAVAALRMPTIPGHQLAVGMGSASYPPSFNSIIRQLLRTGTPEELRQAGQPVVEAARLLEQLIRRNLPFSAVVAGLSW